MPEPGMDTLLKGFKSVAKKYPNAPYLGTRDEGKEGRPYVWKTRSEVQKLSEELARGFEALGLIPEVEHDGKSWKFMGIMSKNREEWALTQFANFHMSVT